MLWLLKVNKHIVLASQWFTLPLAGHVVGATLFCKRFRDVIHSELTHNVKLSFVRVCLIESSV